MKELAGGSRLRPTGRVTVGALVLLAAMVTRAVPLRAQEPAPASEPRPVHPTSDCASCHTCEKPTSTEPCLRTCTRRLQEQFAESLEAQRGPRVVILDELVDRYLPVPFDHAGHADMAAMAAGCATCHHYTPEGTAHPACKTCHAVEPGAGDIRMPGLKGAYHRQCMNCHKEWSGEARCGACHQPRTSTARVAGPEVVPTKDDLIGRMHPPIPEPDLEIYDTSREGHPDTKVIFRHREHIHRYGLRCAECHHEDNCTRCHEAGKNHSQRKRTLDEHHKPCATCHQIETTTCDQCHYDAGSTPPQPFTHDRTGWPLSRYHSDLSCRACHKAVPFGKQDRNCLACHVAWSPTTFDHAVTGQPLDATHIEIDCEECHLARRFDTAPTCTECHDEDEGFIYPTKRPGPAAGKGEPRSP